MTEIIAAILHRPMIEIAALAGILCVIIISAGVAIYLIFRGLSYLRIKKIGVTGTDVRQPRRTIKRGNMCKLVLRSFFFFLVLASCSSLVYALESPDSSPLAVSSESSGQQSSADLLKKDLPEPPTSPEKMPEPPQVSQAKNLTEYLTQVKDYVEKVKAYTQAVDSYVTKVTDWSKQVNDSWQKVKDTKAKEDAVIALQLNSRDFENESLKAELRRARLGEFLYGSGGFAAGWAAAKATK